MKRKYFLYIDILGFSDLVKNNSKKIEDLYEVIASLNAHAHNAFKVVVFSDTILVYNVDGGDTPMDSRYLIMFMCEFVKDLIHRLMGRDIKFRAIITRGDFTHYELNGMPCFWGNALVDAYNSEKEIKAIGLFIQKEISQYCDIFHFCKFNDNFNFVYVTQALNELEVFGQDGFPISKELIVWSDSQWHILPELNHINEMYSGSINPEFPDSVKNKYKSTWNMYCKKYPNITSHLIKNNQDLESFSPDVDWAKVFERHPQDFSSAIKSKIEF